MTRFGDKRLHVGLIPPVGTPFDPADGATGVNNSGNLALVLTFDQNIDWGATVLFRLFVVGSGSPAQVWDNARIGVDLFKSAQVVNLNATGILAATHYCVKAAAGSVISSANGALWPGIANETSWDFTTAA